MNQPRSIFPVALVFSIILLSACVSYSQGENKQHVDPNYDVSLQVVIGSNDAGQRSELPANLSSISKQLKNNFAFSNYRIGSTLLGRIADTGSFEYKSVANGLAQESDTKSQTFLDWSLFNFRSVSNEKGPTILQAQSFRFGARVPVTTGNFKDGGGNNNPVINYEAIGLSLGKIGLTENVPTLIGTLSLPGTSGTIFLVMTVRSAD